MVKEKESKARFAPEGHAGYTCREYCFNNNIISRAVGDVMMMAPPLVISKSEIDELMMKFRECLDLSQKELMG